ncbi:hypothetical protein ACFLXI_05210 [Chloroflexota bacterium]
MPRITTSDHKSHATPDHFIHSLRDIPLQEIHELLDDTAQEIASATTSSDLWPAFILYLLEALETHTRPYDNFDERLVCLCERVTRRLNKGRW